MRMIKVAPLLLGFLNGMSSLVRHGLTSCAAGFASDATYDHCWLLDADWATEKHTIGVHAVAHFSPEGSPSEMIDEIALLLTDGRLSAVNKQVTPSARVLCVRSPLPTRPHAHPHAPRQLLRNSHR